MDGSICSPDHGNTGRTVKFLGTCFQIPSTVFEYLDYRRYSDGLLIQLEQAITTRLNRERMMLPEDLDDAVAYIEEFEGRCDSYKEDIGEIAKKYVSKLMDNGVLDISADSLSAMAENSKEFSVFKEEVVGILNTETENAINAIESEKQGVISDAAEGITGSGLNVYSSNIGTVIGHQISDEIITGFQTYRAKRKIDKATEEIVRRNVTAYIATFQLFRDEIFASKLLDLIKVVNNSMFEAFLSVLSSHGRFDASRMEAYDESKAKEALKNLELTCDKEGMLKHCFSLCPYCQEVFNEAFDLGLMDDDTFDTAGILGLEDGIKDKLIDSCKSSLGDERRLGSGIDILSRIHGGDRKRALGLVFSEPLEEARTEYKKLLDLVADDEGTELLIRSLSGLDTASELLVTSTSDLFNKVLESVVNVVSPELVKLLDRESAVDLLGIPNCQTGDSFQQASDRLTALVVEKLQSYASRLHRHVDACKEKADEVTFELDRRKEKKDDVARRAAEELARIEETKRQSNPISFFKRKYASDMEKLVKSELSWFEDACSLQQLEEYRNGLLLEAEDISSRNLDIAETHLPEPSDVKMPTPEEYESLHKDNLANVQKGEDRRKGLRRILRIGACCALMAAVAFAVYQAIIAPALKYDEALSLIDQKRYGQAIELLDSLGSYRDAEEQSDRADKLWDEKKRSDRRRDGINAYQEGLYSDALDFFEQCGNYEDCGYYAAKCLIELGRYDDAIDILSGKTGLKRKSSEVAKLKEECFYKKGVQAAKAGNLLAAEESLNNAVGHDGAKELLAVVSEHARHNYCGVYQQVDDEKKYLLIACSVDTDTLEVTYEAYFQDSIWEESYKGVKVADDGALMLIDTFDSGFEPAEHDNRRIEEAERKFQPDSSVYASRRGSGSVGVVGGGSIGPQDRKSLVTFTIDGDTLTEHYHYAGHSFGGEPFDNAGTKSYRRIE